DPIARKPVANGSRASRDLTANPAHCDSNARRAGQRDIRIRRREDLRQAALQALSNPAERDHLKTTRPRIERLPGLIVYRYQARKSRYHGTRKSTFQTVWTAVLVNLHPIAAALRVNAACMSCSVGGQSDTAQG
ncbi:MAG: transposase, partial [Actinobacteria bacterium]|nr:transposase [Actinomycetota bacterium]